MRRSVIFFLALVLIGSALWPWLRELGLASFPGDVTLDVEGMKLHFPFTTAFVITSVVVGVWRLLDRN